MSWTEERVEELKQLWESGKSASEIGKILGVSKNSVVGKAHRLKLQARPSPIRRTPAPKSKSSPPKTAAKTQSQAPKKIEPPVPAPPQPTASASAPPNTKGPKCLWPIGDPGDPDFHFCGAPAIHGKPYCGEHCARAYITKPRGESKAA